MACELLLSIDQGTTNTKASLIGRDGLVMFRASRALTLKLPRPGFVEQSPQEIWDTAREVMLECATYAAGLRCEIAGIAISNQRETALAWRSGGRQAPPRAIGQAVSWQCRRSAELCAEVEIRRNDIRTLAGLPLDPLLSAGKWAWMLRHVPEVQQAGSDGTLKLGTVDAWLLACLTCGEHHRTDASNASRTGLLELETLSWSTALLSIFDLPRQALPQVCASSMEFGRCTALPELSGVPIVAMVGDSHAAMAGHGRYGIGMVKATYGTGSSLMALAGGAIPPETALVARTVAWAAKDSVQFALEGNIAMTGSALQWVGEFLRLEDPVQDAIALSDAVDDAAGLIFVPAMVGLGAPYWDTDARGTVTGLERSHTSAHLARAAIESIAHQVADVLGAMETASGLNLSALCVDGGPTRNDRLMQLQADLLGREVLRSSNEELSALGAAALGGLTLGWWNSLDDFATRVPAPTSFQPRASQARRVSMRNAWAKAVSKTLTTSTRSPA